jgi:hypothetical protein
MNKLKRFRRNATRYDRNPRHLLALLCLAAVVTLGLIVKSPEVGRQGECKDGTSRLTGGRP